MEEDGGSTTGLMGRQGYSMGSTEGHGWPVLLTSGAYLSNNHVIVLVRQQHLLGTDLLLGDFFTITLSEP